MPLKLKSFGHAQHDEVERLENQFDISLPNDYKEFLLEQNGGKNQAYEFENTIRLSQIEEDINIDTMFGEKTGFKNADIEQWTNEYVDDIFEHSIIIGDTVQHGFLIMWLSNDENEGIYYYDDTYYFSSSTDENNAYFLAKSFSEFLGLVKNK